MLIDAHLDLAFNAVALGADITLPLDALRASAYGQEAIARGETPTVSLPILREADVRVAFGTIFVQPGSQTVHLGGPTYLTAEEANTQGWAQLRYYQGLAARHEITLIANAADLDRTLDRSTAAPALVPLMEGADPIRDVAELEQWYAGGIRIIGLAWSATRYSGGTGAPGPLTAAGRELVGAMRPFNLALDTSHMAEESFWQALELHNGPVLASHSNCRAFVSTDRQLSDDMIRAIVERDGVIGVVPFNKFLVSGWTFEQGKSVQMTEVVRHIEHICELAGDTLHVGIGSDFDGGFGVESTPAGIQSIADLHNIYGALVDHGWRSDDAANVLSGNWARWLRTALP